MATKTAPPTARGVALGVMAHIAHQAVTMPASSSSVPAAKITSSALAKHNMDTKDDDTLQTRLKAWKKEVHKSPPNVNDEGWEPDLEDVVSDTSGTKTSTARTLSLWGMKFAVPPYASWSSTMDSQNKYDPFYTYQSADPLGVLTAGGRWIWQLSEAKNASGKPTPTRLVPPSKEAKAEFATEHVFEIQIISQFFTFLQVSKAAQTALLTKVGPTNRSPIESLAASLPSDKEFIYLQTEINGIKMVYFKMGRPTVLSKKTLAIKTLADAQSKAHEVLRKVTLTILLASYMNQPAIYRLYNAVRGRIEAKLEEFASSSLATYTTTIKTLDLPAAFQTWHQSFIQLVALNMQDSVNNGFAILQDILTQVQSKNLGPATQTKALETTLEGAIKEFKGAMQEKGLNNIQLGGLMTQLREEPGKVDLSKLSLSSGNASNAPWGLENSNGQSSQDSGRGTSVEPQFGDGDEDREDPEVSTSSGASRDALKGTPAKATLPPKNTPGGKNRTPKTNNRVNPVSKKP